MTSTRLNDPITGTLQDECENFRVWGPSPYELIFQL